MIKAVLFDFDGTIVDSLKYILPSWKQAYALQNINLSDEEIINNVFYAHPEERALKYGVDGEKLHRDYHRLLEATFQEYEKQEHVEQALKELCARGIKTAIVTAGNAEKTREILTQLGLEKLFGMILDNSDVVRPKPAPDIALKAMEILQVRPEESVLIGDSATDILTGKNAGTRTGLYRPEANARYIRESLSNTQPDFEFTHFSELLNKLDQLP